MLHFEKWSDTLFREYVEEFLKIKLEASGWPKNCQHPDYPEGTPLPDSDDEEILKVKENRRKYLEDTFHQYGIRLDTEKIRYNPGLRYIAKLCLNNLCKFK